MSGGTLTTAFPLVPTWWRGNAWRRTDSGIEHFFDGTAVLEAVTRAERAGFDIAFRPDVFELRPADVAREPGHLGLDPVVQIAALAQTTSRITLIPTFSATFAEPYQVARQLVSLEQLSGGRIGWNIVTSLTGDRNVHTPRGVDSASRWRRAAEFVEVVERLRATFPPGALLADRETGDFTDSNSLRPIDHDGEFFRVAGPLTAPALRPGRLPLLQAGAAPAGRDFAARHADLVFSAWPDIDDARAFRADLVARAQATGREPGELRVLQGLNLVLADTPAEAQKVHDSGLSRLDREREAERGGPLHWSVIGTPAQAVEQIVERFETGALDGFIAFPTGWPRSLDLLFSDVMPALARLGLVTPTGQTGPPDAARRSPTTRTGELP